jgi:antitoxin YefM
VPSVDDRARAHPENVKIRAYNSPPMSGTVSRTSFEESEMQSITAITASDARARLFPLIQEIVDEETTVHVTSKHGTIVMMSEAEYRGIMETLHVFRDPVNAIAVSESILEFMRGGKGIQVDPVTLKPINDADV